MIPTHIFSNVAWDIKIHNYVSGVAQHFISYVGRFQHIQQTAGSAQNISICIWTNITFITFITKKYTYYNYNSYQTEPVSHNWIYTTEGIKNDMIIIIIIVK